MKYLIIFATLIITSNAFASNSIKVCSKENQSQSITFTVVNPQIARLAISDGSPVQNYKITKVVKSNKGDDELTKFTGEVNISYTQYVLKSAESEDYLMTTIGVSGAQYLVLIGPMAKLIELGSSTNCK